MEFLKKLKLSFLSVVFVILLPVIILIASGMAVLNYQNSYESILEGLNKKLLSISSVTASFIDGEDHIILAKPKNMISFSYDKVSNKLYSVDDEGILYYIDTNKGAAKVIDSELLNEYTIRDISIDEQKSILYAISSNKELLSVDLNETNSVVELEQTFDFELSGLVYDPINRLMYISSQNSLYKIEKNKTIFLKKFKNNLFSLNIEQNSIYGINRDLDSLFTINLNNLNYKNLKIKDFPIESSSLHMLAMNKTSFFAGSKHLMIYDRKKDETAHADFARLYRDETSPKYKKYIEPMTKIKVALNLTYHYTFNLLYDDPENNSFYIFDVNEGNEYTPIGSYDSMDHEDLLGAENVLLRNKSYIGEVKHWEKWGLLKVAYAGIKNKDGKVVAVAGTDIDITIIKAKTNEALVHSITIGIVALVLSVLAFYYIAIMIVKPIDILKSSALKVAAGKYDQKVEIKSPLELSELSNEFNYMSDQLTNQIKNFKQYGIEVKDKKLSSKLFKKLSLISHVKDVKISIDDLENSMNPHGVIASDNKYFAWVSKEMFNKSLEVGHKSAIMADVLTHLLKQNEHVDTFMELFALEEFVCIDIEQNSINDLIEKKQLGSCIQFETIKVGDMTIRLSMLKDEK